MRPGPRLRVREGLRHVVEGAAEVLVPAALRLLNGAAQHAQRALLRQLRSACALVGAVRCAWTGAYMHVELSLRNLLVRQQPVQSNPVPSQTKTDFTALLKRSRHFLGMTCSACSSVLMLLHVLFWSTLEPHFHCKALRNVRKLSRAMRICILSVHRPKRTCKCLKLQNRRKHAGCLHQRQMCWQSCCREIRLYLLSLLPLKSPALSSGTVPDWSTLHAISVMHP